MVLIEVVVKVQVYEKTFLTNLILIQKYNALWVMTLVGVEPITHVYEVVTLIIQPSK